MLTYEGPSLSEYTVPKRFWFQNSLDAITNILNNEREYLQAKTEKQIFLHSNHDNAGYVARKARQLKRLVSQTIASKRALAGLPTSLSLPVNDPKTCWIICGPESSGSVLIAKTISHAVGASKQFSDYSGYGYNGEIGIDNLVLHRSIPFLRPKKNHHDLLVEIDALKQQYSVINYILTTRDPLISIISKANRFGGSLVEGQEDIELARDFFASICKEPTCFIWSYETMQLLGDVYFKRLYEFFDISSEYVPSIRDANSKYLLPSFDISADNSLIGPTPIIYFINLFLKDGILPEYEQQTINALLNAVNHSASLDIKIVVMVDDCDYKYFKRLFRSHGAVFHVFRLGNDSINIKLPKLRDIFQYEVVSETLGRDYVNSSYCIYANADICLPTYFFHFIHQQIIHAKSCSYPKNTARASTSHGDFVSPDSFVINRRDVIQESSGQLSHLAWHPGSDLFVFPTRFLLNMNFGDVTIGLPPVAPIIWLNLLMQSQRTLHISDSFITWHYGNDQTWRSEEVQAEINANTHAAAQAFWKLIDGDKSKIDGIRFEDSINAKNLRSKALLFVSMAESETILA
jgi:hypothetical protein